MALELHNLSIGYNNQKVLAEGINQKFSLGELVGLVGQNGVGKSTLIRTICGLQPMLKGDVLINQTPINQIPPKEMARKVAVVLTGRPESMNLSVLELIALGRHPYTGWLGQLTPTDRQKIEEAISLMEISYLIKKRIFELSDGQLQKIMIARALAQDTEVIILDEPTSHLDLKNKIEVLHLLEKIAHAGKTVIISTHEIQLSAQVCDLFWCMDFGQPMLTGHPEVLLSKGKVQEYLHIPKEILK